MLFDRRMSRWSTKDADEDLASLVLRTVLGVPVAVHDDRSGQSKYDLQIRHLDGRIGAAEVVSTRDQARTALAQAVVKRGYVQCKELSRLWMVHVPQETMIRKIEQGTRLLLARLEGLGIDQISVHDRSPMREALKDLGIQTCWSASPTAKHPPGFYMSPDVSAAWVGDGDSVTRFCEEFLSADCQADVLAKLGQALAEERHAVILITIDQVGPFTAIDTGELPRREPELPAEVDWLWMIASKSLPIRAVYWKPGGPWSDAVIR